jgi:hypothetical protein
MVERLLDRDSMTQFVGVGAVSGGVQNAACGIAKNNLSGAMQRLRS